MSGTLIFNKPLSFTNTNSYTIGNVFITTSGNVGINITNPSSALHLSGSLRISSGGLLATFNSNTVGALVTTGGNIGINTTSPGYHLDVNGNVRINQLSPNALIVGDPALTGFTSFIVQTASGNLQLGIAPNAGGYSTSAAIGDSVIRGTASKSVMLQTGSGSVALCLTTNGNVAIGTTSQNTRLSITPSSTEAKITLWDDGNTTNHYGFGISSNSFNYHVSATGADHVFYAGGKNGNGTELLRIKGTGLIQANSFKLIHVFNLGSVTWHTGVNSSNFTVGSGSKMLYFSYAYYCGVTGNVNAYFDIYTSGGSLVTTLTTYFCFNYTGLHMPTTYTTVVSNTTMPAGTYYIRARNDGVTNADDYLYAVLVNYPF